MKSGYFSKRKFSYGTLGAPAASDHPFRVLQRDVSTPPAAPSYEYGVVLKSSLFKSLRPNDKQAITGLLNDAQTSGWFTLQPGGYIWLGVVFDNAGVITSVTIDHSDANAFVLTANAWAVGVDSYCADNGVTTGVDAYKHQTSRKLIAYIVAGGAGEPPVVNQVMLHDQMLRNVCIDGRPARYPFDHEGGYPL